MKDLRLKAVRKRDARRALWAALAATVAQQKHALVEIRDRYKLDDDEIAAIAADVHRACVSKSLGNRAARPAPRQPGRT